MLHPLPEMVELFWCSNKTYQKKHKFLIKFMPPEGHQVVIIIIIIITI